MEQYRNIRQRDSGGGVKTSWRITVRQLEAMIRLSESMARIHCSDVVRRGVISIENVLASMWLCP